jgi:alkylhydroperoxidase/carboxymuconolactone decarboxylase family protein YurZ
MSMRFFAAIMVASLSVALPFVATKADTPEAGAVQMVAPALEAYARETVFGSLWKRPELLPRDRSIVTLSVLIARNQTIELPFYLGLALDNGVKPAEISEIITHLAFYSGWANAVLAASATRAVFEQRGIGADQLSTATVSLLPLDQKAEEQRAARVKEQAGTATPGLGAEQAAGHGHGGFRPDAERRHGLFHHARNSGETTRALQGPAGSVHSLFRPLAPLSASKTRQKRLFSRQSTGPRSSRPSKVHLFSLEMTAEDLPTMGTCCHRQPPFRLVAGTCGWRRGPVGHPGQDRAPVRHPAETQP